ncbi:carbonic anhydrase family protein [Bacillus sp. AFS055030]|uniref:carbonic anhydrase n=1 Tax=Bacillus sp. AFS055030 TaxID=2033507 RepID=UPI0015D4D3DF|nr:carbonic anhydrase family protein [Bacillus sp. AFS055030]
MNYFFLFVILFSFTLSACSKNQIIHEFHLNKSAVTAARNEDWSYTGKTGPNYWGSINKEYALCSNGKQQSPVNIDQTKKKSLPLGINYHNDLFKIEKSQYTLNFIPINHSNSINLNGINYTLQQFHFHTPSEHTINGKRSDLEIHFINESKQKSIITIGVLVESGRLNKEFQKILHTNPIDDDFVGKVVKLNLQSFIPYTSKKFSYTGSFTTPPCTEGIKWIIYNKPIQFSEEQIQTYQNYFNPNSRPVQPLNGRDLFESW